MLEKTSKEIFLSAIIGGTFVPTMIVGTDVPTRVVETAVPTRVVGTATQEIYVPTIIDGTAYYWKVVRCFNQTQS